MKRFTEKDIAHNKKMYDVYINELEMQNGWLPGNQEYNFQALLRLADMAGIPLRGKKVLDVGCGTGDFAIVLHHENIARYVGVDIYKPSLEIARKNHKHDTFLEGDILNDILTEQFDYAFSSGALTVNLSIDNYEYMEAMVRKMWEVTDIGVAFNVLTDQDPDPDHDLFFYNPERVLQLCHDIAPDAIIGAEETPHVAQIHVYMYRDITND
jgi:ubiquinone/menaquinone biosynthesis C-methylase UbiE